MPLIPGVSLPSINFGGIIGVSSAVLQTLFKYGLLVLLGWVVYIAFTSKIVVIFKRTASGRTWIFDLGKTVYAKKRGVNALKLRFRRWILPPPLPEQTFGGVWTVIMYEHIGESQLYPVTMGKWLHKKTELHVNDAPTNPDSAIAYAKSFKVGRLKPIVWDSEPESAIKIVDATTLDWNMQTKREKILALNRPSMWSQIAPVVGLGIFAVAFMLTVILVLDKFTVIESTAEALQAAAEAYKATQIQTITPPA